MREWLLVLVIGAICCSCAPASACDCLPYATKAVKSLGIKIETAPLLVWQPDLKRPGRYAAGIIFVRDLQDCRTTLHELFHHAQWERAKDAKSEAEWHSREMEAAMFTMFAEEKYGTCQ